MKFDYLKKYWRSLILGFAMLVATTSCFAHINDCKSPVAITIWTAPKQSPSPYVPIQRTTMRFCEIPTGSAEIGSERGESDEKPVTKRDFKNFQIGQYTVTQEQFRRVMGETPWKRNEKSDIEKNNGKAYTEKAASFPATYVSYKQAKQFALIMGLIDPSATYRLPTEAEFEYAARAGTTTEYYWGDQLDASYYAYYDYPADHWQITRERALRTVISCPADDPLDGRFPGYCANNFGLMHMVGNVWQWTEDNYVANYNDAPTNGNTAVVGEPNSERVIRGGSWINEDTRLRSAYRSFVRSDYSGRTLGFRLVRIPKK